MFDCVTDVLKRGLGTSLAEFVPCFRNALKLLHIRKLRGRATHWICFSFNVDITECTIAKVSTSYNDFCASSFSTKAR